MARHCVPWVLVPPTPFVTIQRSSYAPFVLSNLELWIDFTNSTTVEHEIQLSELIHRFWVNHAQFGAGWWPSALELHFENTLGSNDHKVPLGSSRLTVKLPDYLSELR